MGNQYMTDEGRTSLSNLLELFTKMTDKTQAYLMGYMQRASEENDNEHTRRSN